VPVKKYVNVNGRTIAEHPGGVRTAYLTDALGSITATVNSSQVVVNTYRWKPFGDRLAKTGAGADPTLGWVGTYGYRRTQRSRSEYYMLARHYDSIGGRWTTVDPLLYDLPGSSSIDFLEFSYARSNPPTLLDPTGLFTIREVDCKVCGKTILVTPGPTDRTTVVVGPPQKGTGKTPQITGAQCIKLARKWSKGKDCVCVNGSFFHNAIAFGPIDPCNAPKEDIYREPWPRRIILTDGYLTGSIRPMDEVPTRSGRGTGRTGACIDGAGKLVGLIVAQGCTADAFKICAKKFCPKGSTFVWLDGSGSSQIWKSQQGKPDRVLGGYQSGRGRPDWRSVDNWIVICG